VLGCSSGSSSIPARLGWRTILLAKGLALASLLTSLLALDATTGATVLELAVSLLVPRSTASITMLVALAIALTITLAKALLATGALATVGGVTHAAVSTTEGVGSTKSSVAAAIAATSKAASLVVESSAANMRVSADGDTVRSCHIGSLHALGTGDDVVLDLLTLGKTLKSAVIVDGGVVDKDLVDRCGLSAFTGDNESKALLAVEELDSSCSACNWG